MWFIKITWFIDYASQYDAKMQHLNCHKVKYRCDIQNKSKSEEHLLFNWVYNIVLFLYLLI